MDLTTVKKELKICFDTITEQLEAGELPEIDLVKKFVKLSDQMQTLADEQWAYEADDFLHLAKQMYQSAKKSAVNEMIQLLHSLEDAKNFCHRTFKE